MNITLDLIVFAILAIFIVASAVLAVTTKRILRAATYLLFVLIGTAGIYFQLNYSFLGAVQLLVYAGGITVLYVFSILLTSSEGDQAEKLKRGKFIAGLAATLAALGICLFVMLKHKFMNQIFEHGELPVKEIGFSLMSAGKYGYVLPFEVISVLLLACIIGGILIARKR
ncbi:MAG TPA: NADH-quinone oxidoreductase subunit J [Candidatus Cryptobacteroides intestinipullorum]|nr:NADH-quinone oxidoreductase subunit J [Candidatus Cryptobacteroides intestinipullorum]